MSSEPESKSARARPRTLRPGWWAKVLVVLAGIVLLLIITPSLYYERSPSACASCHEISQPYNDWHTSTHRNVPCSACHGSVFTLNAGFHINNLKRLYAHVRGDPKKPELNDHDAGALIARCRSCHQEEFAEWRSSRHSATYADIFLNSKQNHRQKLMDDCLRCHAMHFEGGIRDLIAPLDTRGPWRLLRTELAEQPAIPCLACHQLHREGTPLARQGSETLIARPQPEIIRPSLALFDRRERDYVPVGDLPMPAMLEGTRGVKISPDQRQALCYQCHAPLETRQVSSGDDRTPVGVHEGLSCFACHSPHGQPTRSSCANCHPQLSNCGIPVETMDTTFRDAASRHNIHSVKCVDCHSRGLPLAGNKGKRVPSSSTTG